MFGGYDPSYNPENLEKKKAENKELSPEQQAMANKWSTAMEGAPEAGTLETTQEAEPTIPETEPQLQANLEEGMAAENELETPDDNKDASLADGLNTAAKVAEVAAPSAAPVLETAATVANVAEAAKAEEAPAPAPETSGIQHFAQEAATESTFAPLSPEEQRDGKLAAEAAHGQTYSEPGENINETVKDDNNLVAQAVSENLADGGLDLNGVGQKLEGDGVDIQGEVKNLDADIAEDLAAASTVGDAENANQDATTANNLAVEAGASALAAKEAAGEAVAAAKHGSEDAMAKIEEANRLADQAENLAGVSEEVSAAAGANSAKNALEGTREMAEEVKDITAKAEEKAKEADADKAEAEANGEKPAEEAPEEEESDEGKTVFSASDFPELNELGPDDGKPKAVSSAA